MKETENVAVKKDVLAKVRKSKSVTGVSIKKFVEVAILDKLNKEKR